MPFQIVRNDITNMQVDAIVNTASSVPGYGAGIDTAVYEAAGAEKLLEKRREIGVIPPGHSALTEGFRLPAKYIIHTVGTPWQGGDRGEEDILRNCYRSVFGIAVEQGFESLAIPLLASGSFGFPKGIALRIALTEIEHFLSENDMDLYLVVFDEKSFSLSSELYGDIDAYINDNYVEEKTEKEYFEAAPMAAAAADAVARPERRRDRDFRKPSLAAGFFHKAKAAKASAPAAEADAAADEELPAAPIACGAPMAFSAPMGAMASKSLEDVVKNLDKTFMELVFSFADAKGLTDVEVQKRANLDRKAFSKLKCGTTKNPSKSTALALAVALELNLDDTKDLLSRAGLALSPCSKQDLIVQYFIEREAYDIYEINVALFEHGEQLLGCASGF